MQQPCLRLPACSALIDGFKGHCVDGAPHARLRRRLAAEFTVRRMEAFRRPLQRIVDRQIDMLGSRTMPVDLYADFALPVPSLAICDLLGIPEPDRHPFNELTATVNDLTATPGERRDADVALP
jgi:cytochrome P450